MGSDVPGVEAVGPQSWLSASGSGVEVEFIGTDGARREPLSGCWNVPFERVAPARRFPSYRGQRNWPGPWWFAGTGDHVGYESWVERDQLMALDSDPTVGAVASQPMWLHWVDRATGRAVRHAPDYFARRRDGTAMVIDVCPDGRIPDRAAAVFVATAEICAAVGWGYARVGELDPVQAANMRWLAGYRHPRCAQPGLMMALREEFTQPTQLLIGACAVGDPVAVLPVLYGMLWRHELLCDSTTTLLGPSSLLHAAAPRPERGR